MTAMPSLGLIMRIAAERCGVRIEDLRLGQTIEALKARRTFCWLALELTDRPAHVVGLYLGRKGTVVLDGHRKLETAGAVDPDIRRDLEEIAIEVMAEAGVRRELGLGDDAPTPPEAIAQRALSGTRAAMSLTIRDIQTLSAAYLAVAPSEPEPEPEAPPPMLAAAVNAFLGAQEQASRRGLRPWQIAERRRALGRAFADLRAAAAACAGAPVQPDDSQSPEETDHHAA